jgi:transcriptional regulator with XRE-family HTH domain
MPYQQRLRALRKSHNLTQHEVAQILHLSTTQYRKYENNQRVIPSHHLITLADYYGVSIEYILCRSPFPDFPPQIK